MSILSKILLFLTFLTSISFAAEEQKPLEIKLPRANSKEILNVDVWLGQNVKGEERGKVIIFSHGFRGSNRQSCFLMRALAQAGYNVFAPDHQDVAGFKKPWKFFTDGQADFDVPEAWTDDTYRDRAEDISTLIQTLSQDARFKSLDWEHLALAGHSLGGYTILGLAGAWPSWQKYNIHPVAVLALSPYLRPYLEKYTLGKVNVPIMYQGGTEDKDITPYLKINNGAFDQTTYPYTYVEFNGANHYSWTLLKEGFHDVISQYAIAFFDQTMRGKEFPAELKKQSAKVQEIRTAVF